MGIFSRRDKDGYDKKGYDRDGYDKEGFDKIGINKVTGTKFDENGFDKYGLDKYECDREGFTLSGHDRFGFYRDSGPHITTGEWFDEDGFDRYRFDIDGVHEVTGTKFDENGFDKYGFDMDDGVHRITGTKFDENGFDMDGINEHGIDREGIDREGIDREGFNRSGFDKYGFNEIGFDKYGFNRSGFNEIGFDKYGFNRHGLDVAGFNEKGFNKDGFDADGWIQFELTSEFSKITSSFNSDFDAFVTLAYNEPTKIRSKLFLSHDEKIGIYSKEFESFSNNNVVHFHIEKAGKQYGTIWNKPKDTGRLQGDNFESGYTLIVNFNKNDSELKSILIKKLGKMNFGSLPSEYTLDCHLNEEYPNDERAKELLQKVVGLFNLENDAES